MGRSHSVSEPMDAAAGSARSNVAQGERYARPAVVLHWLMAVLLIGQLAVGLYMVELPKRTPEVAYFYNLHKSFGLIALMLIAVRLAWRWRNPPPPSTVLHRSAMQEKASRISHRLLYLCMLLIPLFGFAGSSFGKYPVKFFGHALPQLGWESPVLQSFFRQAHSALAWLLCALIVLHLMAVAYHLATSGKMILQRMSLK